MYRDASFVVLKPRWEEEASLRKEGVSGEGRFVLVFLEVVMP
jgi:hypothetical protein